MPGFSPSQPPRVVFIGHSHVGKTSILNRLTKNLFKEDEAATVGAQWVLYTSMIHGTDLQIQLWDTAGQEMFRSLGPLYYHGAVGAILVFDITDRSTFEGIDQWSESFTSAAGSDTDVILVGNKLDLAERRTISESEAAEAAADRNFLFIEASAKDGTNVSKILEVLAEAIVKRHGEDIRRGVSNPAPNEEKGCC
jgi:small GTP-binding protein